MNQKTKITSIALVAILAVGIGTFATFNFDNQSELGIATNPNEFTNKEYTPVYGQYVTIDAMELASLSDDVVKGTITNIEKQSILVANPDPAILNEDGTMFEPRADAIIYTIDVQSKLKGNASIIEVTTIIPSKIGYSVGDKVLVMTSTFGDDTFLLGGPHSMFKLKDGKAVGHEFTFEESSFTEVLKTAKDKSSELRKK